MHRQMGKLWRNKTGLFFCPFSPPVVLEYSASPQSSRRKRENFRAFLNIKVYSCDIQITSTFYCGWVVTGRNAALRSITGLKTRWFKPQRWYISLFYFRWDSHRTAAIRSVFLHKRCIYGHVKLYVLTDIISNMQHDDCSRKLANLLFFVWGVWFHLFPNQDANELHCVIRTSSSMFFFFFPFSPLYLNICY